MNGFVLAGGQSRRMGRAKPDLPWGPDTLLHHMVHLLSTVTDQVRVVGRADLPDRISGQGPLGGILTALETTDRTHNLIVAVDLPLLTPDFLKLFQSRFLASSRPLLACRVDGRFPLCLGIQTTMMEAVLARVSQGQLAIQRFIEQSDPEILEEGELQALGLSGSIFHNINTPEDLERHRAH